MNQVHKDTGQTKRSTHTRHPKRKKGAKSPTFQSLAQEQLHNKQLRANLEHATHTIRSKRCRACDELASYQDLRAAGAEVKDHTLRHLDTYLALLEKNLKANGAQVHWASNAHEANEIVVRLVRAAATREVVKVKSMVSQEIELNDALAAEGIAAWETDLAELIVQLGHDRPSHILVPAIHKNRYEVQDIFLREMQLCGKPAPEDLGSEPTELADCAREHLREKFLEAKVAISGANFAVAESGTLAVVESEGNGRMCLTLADTLISLVGIEKVIPTLDDLEIFMQLLPRASTGERMNPYTSFWSGVSAGDGPQNVHVILIDNGRTRALADPNGRAILRCIRCSACMNICPVYERVGGHAYGSVYPGPMGCVLTPQLRGLDTALDCSLPYASTLCGACAEVCPVEIPLPDLLVHLRHEVVESKKRGHLGLEQIAMAGVGWVMTKGSRFGKVGALASASLRALPVKKLTRLPWKAHNWTRSRDLLLPTQKPARLQWRINGGRAKPEVSAQDAPHTKPPTRSKPATPIVIRTSASAKSSSHAKPQVNNEANPTPLAQTTVLESSEESDRHDSTL